MAECQKKPPEKYPEIVRLIRNLRADLVELFPEKDGEVNPRFLGWLVACGLREYVALREDKDFANFLLKKISGTGLNAMQFGLLNWRTDLKKAFPLPQKVREYLIWFYLYGVREYDLWKFQTENELSLIRKLSPQSTIPQHTLPVQSSGPLPFGVNIIGYIFGQLGIGEDARTTGRALQAVNVPFTMLNFQPGKDIPQNDKSMLSHVSDCAPYAINLFCLTAEETGRYYAEKGNAIFRNHYNIGYWPWELGKWPARWRAMFPLVDEIWVSSRHIYEAVAPESPVPVLIMPLAVDVGLPSSLGREYFGLPRNKKLFFFSFDFNSSIHRKNPEAALKAFLTAFPTKDADNVALVVKAHKPLNKHPAWEALKQIASGDQRIYIIEQTLSYPDTMALYKCCDCFISLHRAEGYGRGLAEALLLGLDLIATGYSGNVDFGDNPSTHLVNYSLVPVRKGQYPHAEGQVWAEPDIGHAAALMRSVADNCGKKEKESFNEFGLVASGKRYKERLEFVYGHY